MSGLLASTTEPGKARSMDRSKRPLAMKLLTVVVALLVVVGISWFAGRYAIRSFFYPSPSNLPPIVDESAEDLLQRLEQILQERAPAVANALQPGLTDEQITDIETAGGFHLSEDLRALYKWHNGMSRDGPLDFIPGHLFLPLDGAVDQRAALHEQLRSATSIQRAFYSVTIGHRTNWLTVFDDGAGDGYFYDPERREQEGAFFYHFAEDTDFRFFPSARNFIAGVVEGFESGAYRPSDDEQYLEEDYEQTEMIWRQYGARNR